MPAGPERARGPGVTAEPQKLVELLLCGDAVGTDLPARRPEPRVQHAVDDERADVSREQVGIGRTDVAAVREPEVGQAGVPDCPPKQVEVAGDVGRAHMRRDHLAAAQAPSGERGELVVERPVLGPLVREQRHRGEERVEVFLAVEAMQRIGRADPAWVKADDVEAAAEVVAEILAEAVEDEADARPSRPTGVDEDRADPVLGVRRWEPRERQWCGRPRRRVVVERHLDGRAFRCGIVAAAGLPIDRRDYRVGRRGR